MDKRDPDSVDLRKIHHLLAGSGLVALGVDALMGWGWAGLLFGSAAAVLWIRRLPLRWTAADQITMFRLSLTLAALALDLSSPGLGVLPLALLGIALALDLVDGWAARRWGSSRAGAVFDEETDQLWVHLAATWILVRADHPLAVVVLLCPALRYLFHFFGPEPEAERPDWFRTRARFCSFVANLGLLACCGIASQSVGFAGFTALLTPLLLLPVSALTGSFGHDYWFARTR